MASGAKKPSGTDEAARRGEDAEPVVSAVGMVSPVGADATQTATSVRAGIRRMRELPGIYLCQPEDPRFDEPDPVIGSAVYHLDDSARRDGLVAEWLGRLAGLALRDLVRSARLSPGDLARAGLFLALPAAGLPAEAADEVVRHVHDFAELDLLPHVKVAFGGRTAALALAEEASELVRSRSIGLAAVGAVDSYLFPERLEALDREWRILCERNADGFQPGEAAAFFLVELSRDARRRGFGPRGVLRGFRSGRLSAAAGNGPGAELAALLDPLLGIAGPSPLVVCDLNGESSRMREWGFALSRLGRRAGALALEHPASALGDVGAASGGLLVALAVEYLGGKHAQCSGALVWAGSDDGERRALLLARA